MRVKRGFKARRRRNRILKHAEGYFGSRSRLFRQACEVVHHAWQYAYKHRKERKREFRALWIAPLVASGCVATQAALCGTGVAGSCVESASHRTDAA